MELVRGRGGIVESAHGAPEAGAREDGQRRQSDVQDAGVAGGAPGLGAALLGGRHLQPDRAVEGDLDGVVVRGVRQRPQTNVLEAALATGRYAEPLPENVKIKLVEAHDDSMCKQCKLTSRSCSVSGVYRR